MRKLVTFLMTLLVGSSVSYVSANSGQVVFEAGYRRDNISWRLEAPSCDPLFETNTRFKDLDIFQIGLSGRTHIGCNWYGRASVHWGWILDGDIEESTKFFVSIPGLSAVEDIEFTNQDKNIVDGRYVVDLDIAFGYPFYFCDCTVSLAPVIGYAFDQQNIRIEDEENVSFSSIGGVFFPTSGSNCCDSKFISSWYGPFVGLDFEYRACDCLSVYAQLEYHWAQFRGKRHSHGGVSLANDFDRRSRDADGWVFKGGVDYDLCGNWTIGLSTTWRDFSASRRHHACSDDFSEFFSESGSDIGSGSNDHFRAHHSWRSYDINATIGYLF